MSRLEELIAKLCPDGVEYRTLGEICELSAGGDVPKNRYSRDLADEYSIPIYSNGIGDNALYGYTDIAKITTPCITIAARGTIGYCALRKTPFFPIIRLICVIPHDSISADFLHYFVQTIRFQVPSSGIPQLTVPMVAKIIIPVPPLEVQQEIVRILDKFTALEAELEAELEARKKQYEFYRELLLNFNEQRDAAMKWMTLGEVGRVSMCKRIMKAETTPDGDVPFFKIGTFGREPDAYILQEKYDEYRKDYAFPKKGDILISAAGTIGRTVIYDGEPAYYQDSNIVWIDNDESQVLNKYLYYCYSMKPWAVSSGGTIARLYNDNINKARIPVPTIAEQERIVASLDRFDTLVNDITQGLPAEIAARRKQYEYYRDKLLTFREKSA
ncbi:MAG: restriction endonuclease subunit S [Caldisericales bacterium]|nr:restriction endonuclease subunit S [Caldisericales bacterium]